MRSRGPAIVWALLAFVVGMLPAFWLAGAVFFTSAAIAPMLALPRLGLYALAVLLLCAGGGALAPARRIAIAIGFAAPMVLVVALARRWDTATGLLGPLFIAAALVAA
jgi:hypothetical protein